MEADFDDPTQADAAAAGLDEVFLASILTSAGLSPACALLRRPRILWPATPDPFETVDMHSLQCAFARLQGAAAYLSEEAPLPAEPVGSRSTQPSKTDLFEEEPMVEEDLDDLPENPLDRRAALNERAQRHMASAMEEHALAEETVKP